MEINGRFWGSLPLATRAGVPFAAELYNMLVLGRTPVQRPYRAGVRCRRLSSDVDWFKEMATLAADDPRVRAGLVRRIPRRELFSEAVRLLRPGERYDVQTWTDPMPAVTDLWALAAAQSGMIRRRAARLTAGPRVAWHRVRNARRAVRAVGGAERTLFICYGNIMRSAFAAEYYRHRAGANGRPAEVQSAGIYEASGRPADPRMCAAGARRGIDLSAHRSRTIDSAAIAWADVILAMDRSHLDALRRQYPAAAPKCFLLALLDPASGRAIEIVDPYLEDESATERVCARIVAAIEGILSVQRRAPRASSRSLPKLSGQNGTI
jgi:protein-tyrosine-phosphatase